jgi:hypothetical protein
MQGYISDNDTDTDSDFEIEDKNSQEYKEHKDNQEIIKEYYNPEYFINILESLIHNKKIFIKRFYMLYKRCPKTVLDILHNINKLSNYKTLFNILKRHYTKKKINDLIYNFIVDAFKRDIYHFKNKKKYTDLVLYMPVYSHKFNKKTNIVKNIACDLYKNYEPKKAMYLYSQNLSDMKKKYDLIERFLCKKDYDNIILESYTENVINKHMPVLYKNIPEKLKNYYKNKYNNIDYELFLRKTIIFYLKNKHTNLCNSIEKEIIETFWQNNYKTIENKFNNLNNLVNKIVYLDLTDNMFKNLKIELLIILIPFFSCYKKYYINAKNVQIIECNTNKIFEILEVVFNNIYYYEKLNINKAKEIKDLENVIIISDKKYENYHNIVIQRKEIINNTRLDLLREIISRNKELEDIKILVKKNKNIKIILEFIFRLFLVIIFIVLIYKYI